MAGPGENSVISCTQPSVPVDVAGEHPVGADDEVADVAEAAEQLADHELADVALGAGAAAAGLGAQHVEPVDGDQLVEAHELLTHDGVVGAPELAGQLDE